MKASAVVLSVILLTGCKAASVPTAPPPVVTVPSTAPASINVLGASRPDQRIDISAQVLTASGVPVSNAAVRFTADKASAVFTATTGTTDADGWVRSIVTTTEKTKITATSGELTFTVDVLASTTPTPALSINVRGHDSITVGDTARFFVELPVGLTPRTVSWNFGDGSSETTTVANISHRYGSEGRFTTTATVIDTLGRSANGGTSVRVVAEPTPSAPIQPTEPTLSVTVSCTNTTPRLLACTAAPTYGSSSVASQVSQVTWYWDDGSANTVVVGSPASLTASHTFPAVTANYSIRATILLTTGESFFTTITRLIVGG